MLGEELRKARLAAGLTQEQLAFKAGLSRNFISLLELDQKSLTFETLVKICAASNVKLSNLVARWERKRGRR